jgi:TatD family-associated radical SAM protein
MAQSVPVVGYSRSANRYINVTNRCTLRCTYCPKFRGTWTLHGQDLRLRRAPTVDEMVAAVEEPSRYEEIVFDGLGEPTLRLYDVMAASVRLHGRGARIRVQTDGLANLVYGRDVTPDFEGSVDTLSVSLNAQDEATYNRYCRPMLPGAYRAMLDFVARAREFVPHILLTALPGLKDVDLAACEDIARGLGVRFTVRERREMSCRQ